MRIITLILVGALATPSFGLAIPGVPQVNESGGTITGIPAPNHQASSTEITVLESKACSAKPAGKQSLQVSNNCDYLRGRFSYRFRDPSSEKMKRVFIGFAITRKGTQHVSFLENSPIYLEESL